MAVLQGIAAGLALATLAYGAPAEKRQDSATTDASSPTTAAPVAPSFVSDATDVVSDISSAVGFGTPAPPLVDVSNVTSHGPFTGTPTTTGALQAFATLMPTVPAKGPNPTELVYGLKTNGQLQDPLVAPYTPNGGLGTDGSEPVYRPQSDFDFESLALGLYQEYIELDLFHDGLARFSVADFEAAGLTADDRFLIEFMADQEAGHATLITNILGADVAPRQCTYNYPYTNVREFLDFSQKLTRFGESGVYGFLNHLDSREAGQLLLQSITTEARQQMIFRQFEGLFPMPVWFEVGVPQSWAWTLLAPYISSCPANQTRLAWQNFPTLQIVNQPDPFRAYANETVANETAALNTTTSNGTAFGADPASTAGIPDSASCLNGTTDGFNCSPGVTRNRSVPLSFPGRKVYFTWDEPGQMVGPNNSYVTARSNVSDAPRFVAWASQLNLTYSPLELTGSNSGFTFQPDMSTYAGDPAINGTMFVAITSTNIPVTPFNLSMINPFMYAGPALYQAG